jgi:hypothetical protein
MTRSEAQRRASGFGRIKIGEPWFSRARPDPRAASLMWLDSPQSLRQQILAEFRTRSTAQGCVALESERKDAAGGTDVGRELREGGTGRDEAKAATSRA